MEGLRKHCPGLIVQFSTGGRSGAGDARGAMLKLKPDMASLSVGSNNFPTRVYENPPDLVDWLDGEMLRHDIKPELECFDLSHIVQATVMQKDGRLKGPLYVQFVMGVRNPMPADERIFDFYIETLNRYAPDAMWCAAGIRASQILVNEWCVRKGGHARTGLEDNVRLDRRTLAPSNAALVRRVVELCERQGRPVASWRQARGKLGLALPSEQAAALSTNPPALGESATSPTFPDPRLRTGRSMSKRLSARICAESTARRPRSTPRIQQRPTVSSSLKA
jgi:uncharacterized protein (DUF849 family)